MAVALLAVTTSNAAAQRKDRGQRYLGFDRNDYPGDAALPALRKTFAYTSYWLNTPPGATHNTWTGKRALLRRQGFGFLVLFNGRLDAELRGKDAAALGRADGEQAIATAAREGFPKHLRIFLDQEEGGRLLPEQAAYVLAWIVAVQARGARAGVYCSGIDVPDGRGTISTARDLAQRLGARQNAVALWVANDVCPPSPGCAIKPPELPARLSSLPAAIVSVWQYAQSPRRQFSAACPQNQASDGNCYAPGLPHGPNSFVDLNVAQSPDPSQAR